jgi:hypothetical protein
MVLEGIHLVSSTTDWVTVELNKKALDYIREGLALKANALEREMVIEGDSVLPNFEFANNLKDEINVLREALEV